MRGSGWSLVPLAIAKAVVLLALPGAAAAQGAARPDEPRSDDAPPRWSAGVTWTGDRFEDATPRWESWSALEARLERRFDGGSVALEGGRFARFAQVDGFGGADLYLDLWPRAYANLRGRFAPDARVIAEGDVLVELFQGMGDAWEPSIGVRRSAFGDGTVTAASAAAARYLGAWYARVRVAHARRSGAGGTAVGALLRRTLRTEDERIEAAFSTGTEVITLPEGTAVVTGLRRTTTAALGGRLLPGGRVAVDLGLGYTTFEGAPARFTASLGTALRW